MTLRELVTRGKNMRSQPTTLAVIPPLATLQREINRMFDDLWATRREPQPRTAAELTRGASFLPSVEVRESDGQIEVFAELPGLDRDEIDVALSADGKVLTVRGEKHPEHPDKHQSFLRSERCYGSFRRSIPLPASVDPDNVAAIFRNGVLEVDLHKVDKDSRTMKRIEIQSA